MPQETGQEYVDATLRAVRDIDDPATQERGAQALAQFKRGADAMRFLTQRWGAPEIGEWWGTFSRSIEREAAEQSGSLDELRQRRDAINLELAQISSGMFEGGESARIERYRNLNERGTEVEEALNYFESVPRLRGAERATTERRPWYQLGGTIPGTYHIPKHVAEQDVTALIAEGVRNARVLSEAEPVQNEDGGWHTRIDGAAVPLEDFDTWWENRDKLRQALLGQDPNFPVPAMAPRGSLLSGIPKRLVQLGAWIVGADGPDGLLYDVPTALPGMKLPFLPDLYGNGDAFKSYQALQTPQGVATMRAVLQEMERRGELEQGFWEQVATQGTGLLEFIAINRAVLGAAKGVGRVLAPSTGTLAPAARGGAEALRLSDRVKLSAQWYGRGFQRAAKVFTAGEGRWWTGMQFGLRDVAEEMIDATVRAAVTGDEMGEAALGGMGEGIFELGIHRGLAVPLRAGARAAFSKANRGLISRVFPNAAARFDYATKTDVETGVVGAMRYLDVLPSKRVRLVGELTRAVGSRQAATSLGKIMDAVVVGHTFGMYQAAVRDWGPEWDGLDGGEKLVAMLSSWNSTEALGNAATYAAFGGAYHAVGARGFMPKLTDPELEQVQRIAKGVVREYASPDGPASIAPYLKAYEELRAKNPELFEDLEFYTPLESQRNPHENEQYRDVLTGMREPRAREIEPERQREMGARWVPTRVVSYGYEKGEGDREVTTWEGREARPDEGFRLLVPRAENAEHAVKEVQGGLWAVVRRNDPRRRAQGTEVYTTPWGAIAQAEAIYRRRHPEAEPEPELAEVAATPGEALAQEPERVLSEEEREGVKGRRIEPTNLPSESTYSMGEVALVQRARPGGLGELQRRRRARATEERRGGVPARLEPSVRAERPLEEVAELMIGRPGAPGGEISAPEGLTPAQRRRWLQKTRGEAKQAALEGMAAPLYVGDRVFTPDLRRGVVVETTGSGEGQVVKVRFEAEDPVLDLRQRVDDLAYDPDRVAKSPSERLEDVTPESGPQRVRGAGRGPIETYTVKRRGRRRDRRVIPLRGLPGNKEAQVKWARRNIDRTAFWSEKHAAVLVDAAQEPLVDYITSRPDEGLLETARRRAATAPPPPAVLTRPDGEGYRIDELDQFPAVPIKKRIAQAANAMELVRQELIASGLDLGPDVGSAAVRLAGDRGQIERAWQRSPAFRDEEAAAASYARGKQAALDYLSFMQQLSLEASRDRIEDRMVRAFFRAHEDLAFWGTLSQDVASELSELGWLDEWGNMKPGVASEMNNWLEGVYTRAYHESEGEETVLFHSFSPLVWLTRYADLGDRAWRRIDWRRPFLWQKITALGLDRWISKSRLGPAINSWSNFVGRRWKSPLTHPLVARLEYESMARVVQERRAKEAEGIFRTSHILSRLAIATEALPPHTRRLFTKLIDAGEVLTPNGVANYRTEDDFATVYGDDARPLYQLAIEMATLGDEVGHEMVQLGLLTEQQFERFRGRYVMAKLWDSLDQSMKEEWGQRGVSAFFPGRNMLREEMGFGALERRIWDPYHVFDRQMRQEWKMQSFFGILHDWKARGIGVGYAALQQRDPTGKLKWGPQSRSQMRTLAWDGEYDPVNGRGVAPEQRMIRTVLNNYRDQMQSREDYLAGKLPEEGQRPYSEMMQALLDAYAPEDGSAGLAVPEKEASEVSEVARMIFDVPLDPAEPGYLTQRLMRGLHEAILWWKRAKTILSPSHWTLARVNDVMNNHVTGGVHYYQFARFVFNGEGPYADAVRDIMDFETLTRMGRPSELTSELLDAGWTQDRFEEVQELEWYTGQIMGGTFVTQVIDSEIASDLLAGPLDPSSQTERFREDMRQVDGNAEAQFATALSEFAKRSAQGQTLRDKKVLKLMGEPHPRAKAEAVRLLTAEYQLYELWAKYAAYKNLRATNPQLTREEVATLSAEKTADYRLANPSLKRWTTNLGIVQGGLWGGSPRFRDVAGQVLRAWTAQPFWTFNAVMQPTYLKSMWRHPLRALSGYLLATTVKEALWRVGSGASDEQRDEFWRLRSFVSPGEAFISEAEAGEVAEAMLDAGGSMGTPWGGNGPGGTLAWEVLAELIRSSVGGASVLQAPSPTSETRMTDVSPLMPPFEAAIRARDAVRGWKHEGPQARARALAEYVVGQLPTLGLAVTHGVVQNVAPPRGRSRLTQLAITSKQLAEQFLPSMWPGAWIASRDGIEAAEIALLDGQRVEDWLSGQVPAYRAPAGERLAAIAFQAAWKSRRVGPRRGSADDAEVARHLMAEVMGEGVDVSGPQARAREKAILGVTRQIESAIRDTYARWRERDHQPGDSFDRMLGAELNLGRDLVLEADEPTLRPSGARTTALGQRIGNMEPEAREYALDFATRFLRQGAFEGARALTLELGRARIVEPELVATLYREALRDPDGRTFHDTLYRHLFDSSGNLREGRAEELGPLYDLWRRAAVPTKSDPDRLKRWEALQRVFRPFWGQFLERAPDVEEALDSGPFGLGRQLSGVRGGRQSAQYARRHGLTNAEK